MKHASTNFNYEKVAVIRGESVFVYLPVELNKTDLEISEMVKDWVINQGYSCNDEDFCWEYQEYSH